MKVGRQLAALAREWGHVCLYFMMGHVFASGVASLGQKKNC